MSSLRALLSALLLLLLLSGTSVAGDVTPPDQRTWPPKWVIARNLDMELHPIRTVTLTTQQFLAGIMDGKPAEIESALVLPRRATDRLPAVVFVMTWNTPNTIRWAEELAEIGVATLLVDSLPGRGLMAPGEGQAFPRVNMIVDAYRGLELLAKHPRIDPTRIAVMGLSKGGEAALYSSVTRFQRLLGPRRMDFAAYVSFYPFCGVTYVDDDQVSDRPIRIFHGTADDWVGVEPCRGYVARLRQAGRNVQLTEYSGARHGFDNAALPPSKHVPEYRSVVDCAIEERPGALFVNSKTGRPFTFEDPCFRPGITAGYDPAARMAAIRAVKELLTETFGLTP